MDDYIKRCDAIEALGDIHPLDYNGQSAKNRILKIPAADVAPVVLGRWVQIGKLRDGYDADHDYLYQCSACRMPDIHNEKVEVPYCWHCGAKMDLEAEE